MSKLGAVQSSRLLVLSLAACVTTSCAPYARPDIEIIDGASAPAPGFSFDGPEAPKIITFERVADPPARGGGVTWHLLRRSGASVATPLRLTYGVVPDGYREMQAPDSLAAGSYRIYAKLTHAGDELYFTVTPDGRVERGRRAREEPRPRHEALLSHTALTWDSVSTPQFTMYLVRDGFIAAHADDYRRQAEAAIRDALATLGEPSFPFHPRIFITRSRDDIELLQGIGTLGWGDAESMTAAVVANDLCRPLLRHELMHLVSLRLWGSPFAPREAADTISALGFDRGSWLREGVAAAAENRWARYSYRGMAAQWQAEGGLIPLDSLVNAFAGYDDLSTYVQSGTLVEYLLETYGSARFRELWREGIDGMPRIYGKPMRNIEQDWHDWLRRTPASERPRSIVEARAENRCPPRRR